MPELEFPPVERPLVSIVLVTYNDLEWVPRALSACLENTDPCYELLVVDNNSTDGTAEFLSDKLQGVRVLLNDRNYGFGVANNLGAAHATGRYLFFLNSDAFVHPEWLAPLLSALEADAQVAAVAPRLLNPDGSLQLAGGLLSSPGAVIVYGDGDDPDKPEYSFPRIVDFSGACLMFRRSAFQEVGGFDPVYGLIYYEDADLSFALWERGYKILYEPRSTITHVGGEPSPAILQLALRNRGVFERRWRSVLASYPVAPLNGTRRLVASRDRRCSDRILVIADALHANALAATLPTARLTLIGESVRSLAREVEVVADATAVLRERKFHYDAVVGDAPAFSAHDELLEQTQPQALRIDVSDFGRRHERLTSALATAGIAAGRSA
jgi:GT2 family glycosyltransferase